MARLAKKLVYGILYLSVLGAVIFGIYEIFVKPPFSCTNLRQDAGEEGVDCGGICSQICLPPDIAPVSIMGDTKVFQVPGSPNAAGILGQVQNPNAFFAAKSFDYVFKLFDEKGDLIESLKGQSFIYAAEIKYLLVPNVVPNVQIPPGHRFTSAELSVSNPVWAKSSAFRKPDLAVQNQSTGQSGNFIQALGTVLSRESVLVPKVLVAVIFSDSKGPKGVSQTEIDNLAPGESRNFVVNYPAFSDFNKALTRVLIYGSRQ